MRTINRLSQFICLAALCFAAGVMLFDQRLSGSPFGPAAYYYTDIPNWQDRFYGSARLVVPEAESFLVPAIVLSCGAAWVFLKLLGRLSKDRTTLSPDGAGANGTDHA